jgi:hypothetical protein
MKPAACLALLAALASANAVAQLAAKTAQQAQEQRQGDPQAQEEQAGNAARQAQRKPGEQPVKGEPQGKPDEAPAQAQGDKGASAQKQKGKKVPPRRRAVPAIIGTMPTPSAPLSYGPVLGTPRGHISSMPTPAPGGLPSVSPGPGGVPAPATITQCIGAQCTDASGRSYQTGVGNAGTDSSGRLCNRSGNTMQCF